MSNMLDFSPEQLQTIMQNLHKLPLKEQTETLELLEELTQRQQANNAKDSLLSFARLVAPVLQIETEPKVFMVGPHHKKLAALMDAVARGEKKRILISVAPRMGKSLLSSYLFPAWYMGKFPNRRIIMASNTADMANGFGRKVRDLIDTPEYRSVFPDVELKADSKAAGQWATNKGGEYYACITPDTSIICGGQRVRAKDAVVGDAIYADGQYAHILQVFNSTHKGTVTINRLRCSSKHPIFVFGWGWVDAEKVSINDLLHVENIYDILRVFFRRSYARIMEHPYVSTLVQHKVALHQSAKRKVAQLRGAWDNAMQTLVRVCELCAGHGAATDTGAHSGSSRQHGPIQPGQLSMGYPSGASEQQTRYCDVAARSWTGTTSTCGAHGGIGSWDGTASSDSYGYGTPGRASSSKRAQEELETRSSAVKHGWVRTTAVHLLSRSGAAHPPRQPAGRAESYMARARETAQVIQGLLLGVRRVTRLTIEHHEARPFINFHVTGANAFIAEGILTHNCGVGGALAGRGANMVVIDDPFSEKAVIAGNADVFEDAWTWFQSGPLQRLAPDGALVIIHTRWSRIDLIGRLINQMAKNPDTEQWDVVEFPAILNEGTDNEKSLWPERWPIKLLQQKKAVMAPYLWSAQYQQNPTGEAGALIKSSWWQNWEKKDPPDCEYVIMSLDAAQESHTRADYNACQVWGVFYDEKEKANIILLDAWKKRLEYPELKKLALEYYTEWEPDTFVIEKKSSGSVLFQEFRHAGIPVSEFTPGKGQDKIARVNSVTDMFESGLIWAPLDRRWARDVVDECNDFPNGVNDDAVDALTLALRRFRTGGFIKLPTDEKEEESGYRKKRHYY